MNKSLPELLETATTFLKSLSSWVFERKSNKFVSSAFMCDESSTGFGGVYEHMHDWQCIN